MYVKKKKGKDIYWLIAKQKSESNSISNDFIAAMEMEQLLKGQFTRHDFVAYDNLTTGLRHKLFRVNQTYNSLTTVVYVKKNVVGFQNLF